MRRNRSQPSSAPSRSSELHHSAFPAARLAAERLDTISICVPTLNEAATIGPIADSLLSLKERGALDQVVVVDGGSDDGSAEIAADAGAEVYMQAELMDSFGPVLGKGDAIWRALSVLHGDVVVFVDGDTIGFGPHFACGLAGPAALDRRVQFVKGYYRRPFKVGDVTLPDGGGRVTELTARPLLKLFFPELAGFHQPLAGEFAARRELLERVPVTTGYGVEAALLIDVYREVGIDAMAQVDLDVRQNRHQDLDALSDMATAVATAILERAGCVEAAGAAERPPRADLTFSA
jgi:glucosyl-3-phosphoglycerate synthase